jgi:hypothetical protein
MTTLNTRVVRGIDEFLEAGNDESVNVIVIPPDFNDHEPFRDFPHLSSINLTEPDDEGQQWLKHAWNPYDATREDAEENDIESGKIVAVVRSLRKSGLSILFLVDGNSPKNMNLCSYVLYVLRLEKRASAPPAYILGDLYVLNDPLAQGFEDFQTLEIPTPIGIQHEPTQAADTDDAGGACVQWTNRWGVTAGGFFTEVDKFLNDLLITIEMNGSTEDEKCELGQKLLSQVSIPYARLPSDFESLKNFFSDFKAKVMRIFNNLMPGVVVNVNGAGPDKLSAILDTLKKRFWPHFVISSDGKEAIWLLREPCGWMQDPLDMASDMERGGINVLGEDPVGFPVAFSMQLHKGGVCVLPAHTTAEELIKHLERNVGLPSYENITEALKNLLDAPPEEGLHGHRNEHMPDGDEGKVVFIFSIDNLTEKQYNNPRKRIVVDVEKNGEPSNDPSSIGVAALARLWCMYHLRETQQGAGVAYKSPEKDSGIFLYWPDTPPGKAPGYQNLWVKNVADCLAKTEKALACPGLYNTGKIDDPDPGQRSGYTWKRLARHVDLKFPDGEMEFFKELLERIPPNMGGQRKTIDTVCALLQSS